MAFAFRKSQAFQVLMGFHISICQSASAALCVCADATAGGLRSAVAAAEVTTTMTTTVNICILANFEQIFKYFLFHCELWQNEADGEIDVTLEED